MTHGERVLHSTRRRVYQKVAREMQRAVASARLAIDDEVDAMQQSGFQRYQDTISGLEAEQVSEVKQKMEGLDDKIRAARAVRCVLAHGPAKPRLVLMLHVTCAP